MATQDAIVDKSVDVSVSTVRARVKDDEDFVDDASGSNGSATVEDHTSIGGARVVPAAGDEGSGPEGGHEATVIQRLFKNRHNWFAYLKTRDFWIVLLLGQILSLAITGTNTTSTLLAGAGVSIPAFQILPNYFLLNLVYTGYTLYSYGFKKYGRLLLKDGWRYIILSFMDVVGNYFVVLAYRYTTILSAQLINFWAIVVVVVISFIVLKVRYRIAQYAGILICVGGMGILIASDHLTGSNSYGGNDHVKGDLFALAGATFYGLSNVFEEFLVSKRPLYEVIGQLGFWGILISGAMTAIFDRPQWQAAKWTPEVGGYLTGFTLILFLFYSLVPMLFRLSSAAFFNISLLTANFWGVLIGIQVFGYSVHWMYPIAFVLIIIGLIVYFMTESVMGEAKKPWLGENQEQGVSGVGTAKWKAERRGLHSGSQEQRSIREGVPGAGVV